MIAFSVHEFFHAWVADRLGDPTPRLSGRVTLNPLRHIDPLGLLALIILRVGWGKPVPINPNNFANPKRDELLVALAGPLSNIALAVLAIPLIKLNPLFINLVILSFNLGIFNLIPIFPLDGFRVVGNLLPHKLYWQWKGLERYGLMLLIASLLPLLPGGISLVYLIINQALDIFLKLV
jgi:Zn-dependent protease